MNLSPTPTPEHIALFWSFVNRAGPDDCWIWDGRMNKGYGLFAYRPPGWGGKRKYIQAHRFAYQLAWGAIPDGLLIAHICDTPRCCNPGHLFLGTQATNNADREAKGRGSKVGNRGMVKGEKHPKTILTEQQVAELRQHRADGWALAKLAAHYGVSKSTAENICKGLTWAEAGGPTYQNKPRAKLTRAQADAIRRRAEQGEGKSALARAYGVAPSLVTQIIQGKIWN